MDFHYVYILRSKRDKKLYIGVTNNLRRRFAEHNSGKNKSTAKRVPLNLLYFEGHLSREDAERRERYFKTAKGKNTVHQMLRNSFKYLD